MGEHGIPYVTKSWNPITGCTFGCSWCWARKMAVRQRGRNGYPADDPFRPAFHADKLAEPLKWRKPQRVAVCFMGDWCDPSVPDGWRDQVMAAMVYPGHEKHMFLLLTKRVDAMRQYLLNWGSPPDHVWLGVSIENQTAADERISRLLKCPAAVRFLSLEPLLGPVDLEAAGAFAVGAETCNRGEEHRTAKCECSPGVDWVIVGGESGPGARPMQPDWVRSIRDQCHQAGVPLFVKQLHVAGRLVKDISDFPSDLQIREFPNG